MINTARSFWILLWSGLSLKRNDNDEDLEVFDLQDYWRLLYKKYYCKKGSFSFIYLLIISFWTHHLKHYSSRTFFLSVRFDLLLFYHNKFLIISILMQPIGTHIFFRLDFCSEIFCSVPSISWKEGRRKQLSCEKT